MWNGNDGRLLVNIEAGLAAKDDAGWNSRVILRLTLEDWPVHVGTLYGNGLETGIEEACMKYGSISQSKWNCVKLLHYKRSGGTVSTRTSWR